MQPNMGETKTAARHGMRSLREGQIIEVERGHIIRATGRKDRHSKVCTAKGPRDRRIRLSAHTAIQFYDVQDRLGYDRPSKAVDWLIEKAKAAIDELEVLPPWHPTDISTVRTDTKFMTNANSQLEQMCHCNVATEVEDANNYRIQRLQHEQTVNENNSFQNSQFLQTHHRQQQQQHHSDTTRQGFGAFSGGAVWSDHQSADINRFQKLVARNNAGGFESGANRFMFNSVQPQPMSQPSLQQRFGHIDQSFTQREPLQSSYSSGNASSVRAWIDQPIANHHQHNQTLQDHLSTLSGIVNFQTPAAFSGFELPAHIRGEYEEQDGIHNKMSFASSDSLH